MCGQRLDLRISEPASHFSECITADLHVRGCLPVSYVTVLWSAIAAAALMLAVLHALIWALDRRAYSNLAFAMVSLGVIGITWAELGMMTATTPEEWSDWVRWFHLPNFLLLCALVVFIRRYLGAGRIWLLWSIIVLRGVIFVINFAAELNFNFVAVRALGQMSFLGEEVSIVTDAVTAPRQVLATVSTLLVTLFILDASRTLWRTGGVEARRRALVIGGSFACFAMTAILNSQLIVWGVLKMPTLIAPPFLITLIAMAIEMSRDTLRATRLARELRESEQSLELAASAAGLGLWSWDPQQKQLWTTQRTRAMFNLKDEPSHLELKRLEPLIVAEDRERIQQCLNVASEHAGEQELQFRVLPAPDAMRWILATGRWETDESGTHTIIRGVVRDVTGQHRTQEELDELRLDLAHVGRVTALGELAFSLAHELRQPLASIMNNVQVAQMMLQTPETDVQELCEILADIDRDDRRAADVIDRMRAMMSHRALAFEPVAVDSLLKDVVCLVRGEAVRRGVHLEARIGPEPLVAYGDRVHLSQVLINLILNAMDAMAETPAARKRVVMTAEATPNDSIEISVADCGPGVAPEMTTKIFEPLFTTKASGMGVGLAVSRTIVDSHHGRLWVESNPDGGATFRVEIPATKSTVLSARGAR